MQDKADNARISKERLIIRRYLILKKLFFLKTTHLKHGVQWRIWRNIYGDIASNTRACAQKFISPSIFSPL